ncbi:MAG: hypothetical protein ABIR57_05630 [Aeromicrobium sp.]
MRIRLFTVIAVLLVASACGDKKAADPTEPSKTPTTATTTQPTAIATGEPVPAKLDVAPGRIGKVHVGMTVAEAAATGFFNTNVKYPADDCRGTVALEWKAPYKGQVDVLLTPSKRIAAMGVAKTLMTDKGIGIGSSLGDATFAYAQALSLPAEAGYGQTGVYVNSGDNWLGFLVNEKFSNVTPNSKITFMEVTKGAKPDLMRDGC